MPIKRCAPLLLEQIEHFFEYYKALDSDKWVKIDVKKGDDVAKQAVMDSINSLYP